MLQHDDVEKALRRSKEMAERGFQAFMNHPLTRVTMACIPANENKETLPLLLRAAFDAGCASGEAGIALAMLDRLIPGKEKPPQ